LVVWELISPERVFIGTKEVVEVEKEQTRVVAKRRGYGRWILITAVLLAGASGLRYWHDQPLAPDEKFDEHAIAVALEWMTTSGYASPPSPNWQRRHTTLR